MTAAVIPSPLLIPLQDHFRPPLNVRRHWHAFHNAWATYIASDLNARLPEGFFAESNVQFDIEIDVAAFDERSDSSQPGVPFPTGSGGASAVAGVIAGWAPPAPAQTVAFSPPSETVEVLVYGNREGPTLAGAIELVSPANKDRPASRDAFVAKCQNYLNSGAGLAIVDVVTDRRADFHDELLNRLAPGTGPWPATDLYAAAYRPVVREGRANLDLWHQPLAIGRPLPILPLYLRGGPCLPADLAAAYDRTCREQRVPVLTA